MALSRDRLARFLPSWLLYHEEVQEGFSRLAAETGSPPRNKNEAAAYEELVDLDLAVINKGWPDFMVLSSEDDFCLVEVKGPMDEVRPQQRVVMEMLARKGIDVYVRRDCGIDGIHYEEVGESKPWRDRMLRQLVARADQ